MPTFPLWRLQKLARLFFTLLKFLGSWVSFQNSEVVDGGGGIVVIPLDIFIKYNTRKKHTQASSL